MGRRYKNIIMKITVTFDHKEIEAMVNKMHRRDYSKTQLAHVGEKVEKAYVEFERINKQTKPSKDQTTIDDMLKVFGGKVV